MVEGELVKVFDQVYTLFGRVLLDGHPESGVTVTINDGRTGQKYDPIYSGATQDWVTGVSAVETRLITTVSDADGNFEFPDEFAGSANNVIALNLDTVRQINIAEFGPMISDSYVEVYLETIPVFVDALTGDFVLAVVLFLLALAVIQFLILARRRK